MNGLKTKILEAERAKYPRFQRQEVVFQFRINGQHRATCVLVLAEPAFCATVSQAQIRKSLCGRGKVRKHTTLSNTSSCTSRFVTRLMVRTVLCCRFSHVVFETSCKWMVTSCPLAVAPRLARRSYRLVGL